MGANFCVCACVGGGPGFSLDFPREGWLLSPAKPHDHVEAQHFSTPWTKRSSCQSGPNAVCKYPCGKQQRNSRNVGNQRIDGLDHLLRNIDSCLSHHPHQLVDVFGEVYFLGDRPAVCPRTKYLSFDFTLCETKMVSAFNTQSEPRTIVFV